jgi:hypothetical protein
MQNIVVANQGANSITAYAAGANGDEPPIWTISGSKTALSSPSSIAVDATGNIYVANSGSANVDDASITVYIAGGYNDVKPIRTISGSSTGLNFQYTACALAVDANGNIYAANRSEVLIFAAGANGDVPPTHTISGTNTQLDNPINVGLDATGQI